LGLTELPRTAEAEQMLRRMGGPRAVKNFPFTGYGGSLADLPLQAEYETLQRQTQNERERKTREQYEQEKAEALKRFYDPNYSGR